MARKNSPELLTAAQIGNLGGVKAWLLNMGADPNSRSESGQTPLHYASFQGFGPIAQLLLENGADPDARDAKGWTPLMVSVQGGKLELAQLLLEKGAKVNLGHHDGQTALMVAAAQKNEAAISRLYAGIHYRSDIEVGTAHGKRIGGYTVSFARTDGAD